MTDKLIGTKPYQVPSNADLGDTAFQDSKNVNLVGIAKFDQLTSSTADIVATTKPNIEPTLLLDFANSETVDSRITFTRESIATRTNRFGLIETVDWNVPRIDYDPVTGECKGFLIEESRTNVFIYSNDFSLSKHPGKYGRIYVTPNSGIAPDGTNTAYKLTEDDSVDNTHFIGDAISSVAGNNTVSCYVKAGSRSWFAFVGSDRNTTVAYFNVANGVVGSLTGSNAPVSSSITNAGNGWWRCSMTVNQSSSTNSYYACIANGDLDVQYSGDGVSDLFVWGMQVEVGAFPTSYIPTSGTAVTREAEVASIPIDGITNKTSGTIFSEFTSNDTGDYHVFSFGDPVVGCPKIQRNMDYSNGLIGAATNVVTSVTIAGSSVPSGIVKVAYAYLSGDSAFSCNGLLGVNISAVSFSSSGNAYIGGYGTTVGEGIVQTNGHIRKCVYYPKRVSNAELQALTRI